MIKKKEQQHTEQVTGVHDQVGTPFKMREKTQSINTTCIISIHKAILNRSIRGLSMSNKNGKAKINK